MRYIFIILGVLLIVGGGLYFLFDTEDAEETEENKQEEENDQEETEDEETTSEADEDLDILGTLEKVNELDSMKYDVTIESPEETITGTFWQKGQNIRMEGELEGQETVVIIDNKDKTAYLYMPNDNMAVKAPLTEVEEVQDGSMKERSAELPDRSPEVIGEEEINGMDCTIVEYTHDDGTTGKVWVWKEHGLPARIESNDTIIEANNIDLAEISNDKFELPEGVEPMEMPAGMP